MFHYKHALKKKLWSAGRQNFIFPKGLTDVIETHSEFLNMNHCQNIAKNVLKNRQKNSGLAQKIRVGRVSGNTGNFILVLSSYMQLKASKSNEKLFL